MRKIFFFIVIAGFLPACATHELEEPRAIAPQKPETFPPGAGTWQKTADPGDGHYNIAYKITSSTCGDGYLRDPFYRVWNFIAKNKGGVIMFDDDFFWTDLPVELDSQGKFSQQWTSAPMLFFYRLLAFAIKINGQIKDGLFSAEITEIYLTGSVPKSGDAPKMNQACAINYKATGYKRYKSKSRAATMLQGEYKSRIAQDFSTCQFHDFYHDFGVVMIPQEKNYNLNIGWLDIKNFPINNGAINSAVKKSADTYALKGKINPETLDLRLTVDYGNSLNCSEDYAIYGEKRFNEADGNDTTVDGLFVVQMSPGNSTCKMENLIQEKRLLDSIKIDDKKMRLLLDGKIFVAELDAENNFFATSASGSDDYKTVYTFSGHLDANAVSGTFTTSFDWPEKKCSYSYKVSGYKLYQHN